MRSAIFGGRSPKRIRMTIATSERQLTTKVGRSAAPAKCPEENARDWWEADARSGEPPRRGQIALARILRSNLNFCSTGCVRASCKSRRPATSPCRMLRRRTRQWKPGHNGQAAAYPVRRPHDGELVPRRPSGRPIRENGSYLEQRAGSGWAADGPITAIRSHALPRICVSLRYIPSRM